MHNLSGYDAHIEVRKNHIRYLQHGREIHLLRAESGWSEDEFGRHVLVHVIEFGRLGKEFGERRIPKDR